MASRCMEKLCTSLIIRVIQIKTTPRQHFTPVRTAVIQKTRGTRELARMSGKGEACARFVGMEISTAIVENSAKFLRRLKLEQWDCWIAARGDRMDLLKKTYTLTFVAALFTIAKRWRQPQYAANDEWLKKMGHTRIMRYYLFRVLLPNRDEILSSVITWRSLCQVKGARQGVTGSMRSVS